MSLLARFILAVVVVSCTQAATAGTTCRSSYACGSNHCCRDAGNHVISTAEGNGPGGIFGGPILGSPASGTCVAGKAQKGEMCDGTCQCDTGLSCYRPMSGICCPSSTCVDASYAQKQHEYWSNCMKNPHCYLPA
ncbi:uncharacterized protein LOC121377934 [Gigantopelta aegis]|uniref:uncharacterized protein LOC121377934 n=1 Tax=Gigantopelta aegis TaxID=1735272 RepID=UPI001B8894B6|nr:uncharacterized protein LOC121377934 [Gigantopelta aegis]